MWAGLRVGAPLNLWEGKTQSRQEGMQNLCEHDRPSEDGLALSVIPKGGVTRRKELLLCERRG